MIQFFLKNIKLNFRSSNSTENMFFVSFYKNTYSNLHSMLSLTQELLETAGNSALFLVRLMWARVWIGTYT